MLEIGAQLADGLAKAHGAGIVHRDLKPENVMITTDGFVKILDFGLAKLRAGEPPGEGAPRPDEAETQVSPHTVAGVVLGTAGYMSPEQARGDALDYRSDQFSLGVVLYEVATGRKAFRGNSIVQTMTAVIEQTPEPIANLRPDFPAPACWAIERCLAKEPRARYASTLDLAQELRSVREHLSDAGGSTAERPRRAWALERRRALRLVVGLCAIVLTVLAAPQIKQSVTRWLARAALPSEMRVAVLPVTVAGTGDEDATCCGGLVDYVAVRLADLSRYHSRLSVVPVAELISSGVRSPSAARQALGVTITVSISVHRVADSLLVSVSLADAEKVRQLAGESRTFPRSTFSPELVVNLVVPLLELQLGANQRTAWGQGASTVPEAGVLYAQALGQTPYQQAQSRLEQYDQARSLEQAIKLLNDAINLEPRYAAAHAALGEARIRLYRLTKDPSALELAEQSTRQALAIDDTRPAAWMTLGMARAQRGDGVQAEKAFTEAIARNPNGADVYRELGLAYQRVSLWDKAEASFRKAVSLQPKSWSSHNHLGSFLFRRERYPEGEAEFRRALEFAPENARVWSNLGGLYLAQERWKDAEAALTTAVRIHPYGPALSNLGYLHTYVNRNDQAAAAAFEQGTVVSPRRSSHLEKPGDRAPPPARTARAGRRRLSPRRRPVRRGAEDRSDGCRGPRRPRRLLRAAGGRRARPFDGERRARARHRGGRLARRGRRVRGPWRSCGGAPAAGGGVQSGREPRRVREGPDVRQPEEGPALRRAGEGGGGEGQEGSLNAATQNRRSEWLASTMSTFSRWTGNTGPGPRSPRSSTGTGSRSAT